MRSITDWDRIEPVSAVYALGEEPPEAIAWQDIWIEDRIRAAEHLRQRHHGWSRGSEPGLERVARLVELA